MSNNFRIKFAPLVAVLLLIFTVSATITLVHAQTAVKYMKVGDTAKYNFEVEKAYIPYGTGGSLTIKVHDISDMNHVMINWSAGEVSQTNIAAAHLILNNDTLTNDFYTCPIHNDTPSKIKDYWLEPYIDNVTETYYEERRVGVELKFSEMTTIGGQLHNVTTRYLWDKATGVLMNHTIWFNNTVDYFMSGYYEQYITETSMWGIDTTNVVPGFSTEFIVFALACGIVIMYLKYNKKATRMIK
jgi:hypothetical protein